MTARARIWRAVVLLGVLLVVSVGVIAPPESCPSVTTADLERSAQAAVNWFVRNQNRDGTWLYLYHRHDDSAAPEYDGVRHAGSGHGPLPGCRGRPAGSTARG